MDITSRLRGKTVAEVSTNGHMLCIRTADGSELTVAWVNGEGVPIKGKPVVSQSGARLLARGVRDLMYFPTIRTKGEA
jgi:hypothetical protein